MSGSGVHNLRTGGGIRGELSACSGNLAPGKGRDAVLPILLVNISHTTALSSGIPPWVRREPATFDQEHRVTPRPQGRLMAYTQGEAAYPRDRLAA